MVCMRMRNVSHMDDDVCEVDLLEGRFETLYKTMRKVCDETNGVKHYCMLSVW
jgi:hypothetical protein